MVCENTLFLLRLNASSSTKGRKKGRCREYQFQSFFFGSLAVCIIFFLITVILYDLLIVHPSVTLERKIVISCSVETHDHLTKLDLFFANFKANM